MKKRVILIAVVLLTMLSLSCAEMLDTQAQKDKNLAHVMKENMSTHPEFMGNFVDFTFVEPGKYRMVVKDINDAQELGKYAYNTMVYVLERNDSKVKTGRSSFVLTGVQGGTTVFEVKYTGAGVPRVTLMGPFEGETYTPN